MTMLDFSRVAILSLHLAQTCACRDLVSHLFKCMQYFYPAVATHITHTDSQ